MTLMFYLGGYSLRFVYDGITGRPPKLVDFERFGSHSWTLSVTLFGVASFLQLSCHDPYKWGVDAWSNR